jgi:hypothetical protein
MDDPLPSATLPACVACRRLGVGPTGGWSCPAFLESIPAPLLEGRADHRRPYPGDRGILFAPDRGAPAAVLALVREAR